MEKLKDVFVTKLSEENGSVVYRINCTEKAATDFAQKEAVREIKKLCEKYNGMIISENTATLTYKVSFPNNIEIKNRQGFIWTIRKEKYINWNIIRNKAGDIGHQNLVYRRRKRVETPICQNIWIRISCMCGLLD